jgi:hypothetical protein
LPDGESEIFFAEGLDRKLVICPSGKYVDPSQEFAVVRPVDQSQFGHPRGAHRYSAPSLMVMANSSTV